MREPLTEEGNLYGRVLQRLALALEEAERSAGSAADLEVRGLTPAEYELIRAYLQQDAQWLSGWHAAAEEQAQLSRRATLRSVPRSPHSRRGKHAVPLRQSLACALCGSAVSWPDGPGAAVCGACGSHLLRARQRLHSHPRH